MLIVIIVFLYAGAVLLIINRQTDYLFLVITAAVTCQVYLKHGKRICRILMLFQPPNRTAVNQSIQPESAFNGALPKILLGLGAILVTVGLAVHFNLTDWIGPCLTLAVPFVLVIFVAGRLRRGVDQQALRRLVADLQAERRRSAGVGDATKERQPEELINK